MDARSLPWLAVIIEIGVYYVGLGRGHAALSLVLVVPAWIFAAWTCIVAARAKGYRPWLGFFCALLGLLIGPMMVIALPTLAAPFRAEQTGEGDRRSTP